MVGQNGAPVGSCTRCQCWGRPGGDGICDPCKKWRPNGQRNGRCRRCRSETRLNRDDLCRLCLLAIRLDDPDWLFAELERCTPGHEAHS